MAYSTTDAANDARDQIAKLREQVDGLMRDRLSPAFSGAADRASAAARSATDMAQEQAEAMSGRVREQPLVAIAIAAGVGFLIGRIVR